MSSINTADNVLHRLTLAQIEALALRADLRDLRARLVSMRHEARAPRQGATKSSPLFLTLLILLAGAFAFLQGCMLAAIVGGVSR